MKTEHVGNTSAVMQMCNSPFCESELVEFFALPPPPLSSGFLSHRLHADDQSARGNSEQNTG